MFTLVYKDFLLQRGAKSFVYMLVMPVVSAFAFATDLLYVILPFIAGSYLYIVYANALDDKYRAEKMFIAMPVKRSTIVVAKYMGIFCYLVVFLLAVSILSFLIKAFIPGYSDMETFTMEHFVQFLTIDVIYYGVFFPLYFKLDYQKSRWVNYIAMLLSAGLYTLATKGLSTIVNREIVSLQASLEYLSGIQAGLWNIFLPLLSILAIAASIRLSLFYYRRREF
ncbi:MAG: ABC-2 transporter permease [Spirochaetales bacterium]|nr:ABC-2 transporter permease [Spirochaetales bacterium]